MIQRMGNSSSRNSGEQTMPELSIDIETFSSVDLKGGTVYTYTEAPDFQILLFSYAIDDSPVRCLDLTKGPLPEELVGMLHDPNCIKIAYNANFERVCLSRMLGEQLAPESWRCTMVHAATLGLPRTLAEVGRVLGLPEDKQKMKEGRALIEYFCKPCKPTRKNGGRVRNLPEHDVEKWETFKAYNIRDVEVERAIRRKLEQYPMLPDELWAYWLDQRINDRGVLVDRELTAAAIRMHQEHRDELTREAVEISGLSNVNSVSQLKEWLRNEGIRLSDSLDKKAIGELRKTGDLSAAADRMLAIRQELGKTSVSKYEAIERGVCTDGRVRGLFAFYGANRTGRWAGRQVQVQNLPQNHLPDLEAAREMVRDGDRESLKTLFGNVPATLSELIRTAFVAKPGYTFVVADFSAIEARVIAWLAGEEWRQRVFAEGGDIYCASASQMFHVPVEKHGVNGHLRQKGKIAELALGYGGAVGALKAMGALEMGLKEEELRPLVDAWRKSNPAIVTLWWLIDRAARDTISRQSSWRYDLPHGLSMMCSRKLLHIRLPSGRSLRYWAPQLEWDESLGFGRENITYGSTEAGAWTRVETYGPKLVENIVQGTARDCLRDAMLRVSLRYPGIVMHIHDEMVVEVKKEDAQVALRDIQTLMADPVHWAPGLLLRGDGYITDFYRKD